MDPLTSRDVSKELNVSVGVAHKLLTFTGTPDVAKFKSKESYLRKLAKFGLRKGLVAAGLTNAVASSGKGRARARARKADPEPEENQNAENLQEPESDDSDELTMATAVETLRSVTVWVGNSLKSEIKDGGGKISANALAMVDKLQKLQSELCKTERAFFDIQQKRMEVLDRDAACRAMAEMCMVMRTFGDSLVGKLTHPNGMPKWIAEHGGAYPNDRESQQQIQQKIRKSIEGRFNELAEKLADSAVPVECEVADIRDECRDAMANQLEEIVKRLRRTRG